MTNPFEAPLDPPLTDRSPVEGPPGGVLDLGLALRQGWASLAQNWLSWLLVSAAVIGIAFASAAACLLPALVVWPALAWGVTRFTLDTLDGEARVDALWDGFGRLGEAVAGIWGVGLLMFLAMMAPTFVTALPLAFLTLVADDVPLVAVLAAVLARLLDLAWTFVIVPRLSLATVLLVDHRLNPIEALQRSWTVTGRSWGLVIALYAITGVVLPLGGLLLCGVGVLPATWLGAGVVAAASRQLAGRGA